MLRFHMLYVVRNAMNTVKKSAFASERTTWV